MPGTRQLIKEDGGNGHRVTMNSVAPGNLLGYTGDEDPRPGPRYGGQGVPRRPTAVSH